MPGGFLHAAPDCGLRRVITVLHRREKMEGNAGPSEARRCRSRAWQRQGGRLQTSLRSRETECDRHGKLPQKESLKGEKKDATRVSSCAAIVYGTQLAIAPFMRGLTNRSWHRQTGQ